MKHLGSPITTVPKLSQNVKLEDQERISEDPMECSLGDQDAKVQCHVTFHFPPLFCSLLTPCVCLWCLRFCVCMHMRGIYVVARGQLVKVSSLLPCGSKHRTLSSGLTRWIISGAFGCLSLFLFSIFLKKNRVSLSSCWHCCLAQSGFELATFLS